MAVEALRPERNAGAAKLARRSTSRVARWLSVVNSRRRRRRRPRATELTATATTASATTSRTTTEETPSWQVRTCRFVKLTDTTGVAEKSMAFGPNRVPKAMSPEKTGKTGKRRRVAFQQPVFSSNESGAPQSQGTVGHPVIASSCGTRRRLTRRSPWRPGSRRAAWSRLP